MISRPPICVFCKRRSIPFKEQDPPTCAAFPDGIPASILDNKADHRSRVRGDSELTFEPDSEAGAEYAADMFED